MLLSHISVDLIFSDHTHQVKMNMLGEPSFQGSGQSQHESEIGSNAALTELDKGLSSLLCCLMDYSDWAKLGNSSFISHRPGTGIDSNIALTECANVSRPLAQIRFRIIPRSFRHLYPYRDTGREALKISKTSIEMVCSFSFSSEMLPKAMKFRKLNAKWFFVVIDLVRVFKCGILPPRSGPKSGFCKKLDPNSSYNVVPCTSY